MILVCGEALIDVFPAGDTDAGMLLDGRMGGSPFNVAIGLARLGQPVAFFGGIGRGLLGERLMRALDREGIDVANVVRSDLRTTVSVVEHASGDADVPAYSFYGDRGADRAVGLDALARLPREFNAVQLGSFACVVEPIATTLRALVQRIGSDVLVAYDANVRTTVEPDLSRWRQQLGWMLGHTHLLKLSDEDLELLYPGISCEKFAVDALSRGVRLVVVTCGARGPSAWTTSLHASVPAHPVVVADTVGAGDSFQAALLAWLVENGACRSDALPLLSREELEEALAFAARAAAITCSRRGADPPRRTELGLE